MEVLPHQRPYEGERQSLMLAYDSRNADYHEFRRLRDSKVIPAESTYGFDRWGVSGRRH